MSRGSPEPKSTSRVIFINPTLNWNCRLRKIKVAWRKIPLELPLFRHWSHSIFLLREGKREIVKLPNTFRFDQSESDCVVCYPVNRRLSGRERPHGTYDYTLRDAKGFDWVQKAGLRQGGSRKTPGPRFLFQASWVCSFLNNKHQFQLSKVSARSLRSRGRLGAKRE